MIPYRLFFGCTAPFILLYVRWADLAIGGLRDAYGCIWMELYKINGHRHRHRHIYIDVTRSQEVKVI